MKRTPLRRGSSPLSRKSALDRSGCALRRSPLRRSPLAKVSEKQKRALRKLRASAALVRARADGYCEGCGERVKNPDVHHVERRSRRPGWEGLHEPENLLALCRRCHDALHFT